MTDHSRSSEHLPLTRVEDVRRETTRAVTDAVVFDMRNHFDSISKIGHIRGPFLFLHSPEDGVIPIAEGRRLYEAAPGDKTFVEVRGGHVDASAVDTERFYGAIRDFLAAHRLLPAEDGASTVRRSR